MDGDICHHSNCEFLANAVIDRDRYENEVVRLQNCLKLVRQKLLLYKFLLPLDKAKRIDAYIYKTLKGSIVCK